MTPPTRAAEEETPTHVAPALDAVGFRLPPGRGDATHVALPSAASARLVLPLAHPEAAAAVLRRLGGPGRTARARTRATVVRTAAAVVARFGFPPAVGTRLTLARDPASLAAQLTTTLAGRGELILACRTGPPRPNAKPVLQMLSADGQIHAFVKVGVNELTSTLVRAEADALAHMARLNLPGISVPVVREVLTVAERPVVVTEPLETADRDIDPSQRVAALQAFARAPGTRTAPLADSTWAAGLSDCGATTTNGPLRDVIRRFIPIMGATPVTLGLVHGDFTPWNIAASADGIAIWDWERMMLDAPLGLDALHFELERSRNQKSPWATQLDGAARRIQDEGTLPGEPAVLVTCYLMDQAVRHLGADVPLTDQHQAHLDEVLTELGRRLDSRAAHRGRHA
ncbi:hypothetical protein [Euzebya tangerina]|uniref:hypothetical protein n=1 Tax=Euzebya tangerina TaxID=591198 RepID=UPI000E31764B|nr:hypothetical protein [Euzebya tangerina]